MGQVSTPKACRETTFKTGKTFFSWSLLLNLTGYVGKTQKRLVWFASDCSFMQVQHKKDPPPPPPPLPPS